MTPAQEAALLQATAAGLDDSLREALADLIERIGAGAVPRDAVQEVMATFVGDFAEIMRTALGALLGAAVGAAEVLEIKVGQVALSRHIYAEAGQVSEVVHGIVQRHVSGLQDARRLALELFEGYGFRDPSDEPIKLSPRNVKLPKYLREALLSDPRVEDDMARAFATIQANGLKTGPLRAAYSELLDAIDGIEDGSAKALIDRKMRTAFFERMRYFALRIARTELHRAYAEREAAMLMDDEDVEYVQVRRGSDHECICTLIAGRNQYGMGAGVYPKRLAPKPPYHPFCRCVLSPLFNVVGKPKLNEAADRSFLHSIGDPIAAKVMGSKARRDEVLGGKQALDLFNERTEPAYRIQPAGVRTA